MKISVTDARTGKTFELDDDDARMAMLRKACGQPDLEWAEVLDWTGVGCRCGEQCRFQAADVGVLFAFLDEHHTHLVQEDTVTPSAAPTPRTP